MFKQWLVCVLLLAANVASAQRILTTPDFTTFSLRDGAGLPAFMSILPLPDGGMILGGRFEVWYEGKRFRDLMRLRPNGDPDTSWRVDITYPTDATLPAYLNRVYQAVLTPTGVFVLGPLGRKINGVDAGAVPYVSLTDARLVNPPKSSAPYFANGNARSEYRVSTYDSATGYVYVAMYTESSNIRRISAVTGELDPEWGYRISPYGSWTQLADSLGGLWATQCETYLLLWDCWQQRVPLADSTSTVANPTVIRPQFTLFLQSASGPREFNALSNGVHAYAARKRFGSNGVEDPAWSTISQPWYVGTNYAYFPTAAFWPSAYTPNLATLKRAALSGHGEPDAWSFVLPSTHTLFLGTPNGYGSEISIVPWPTPGDSNNIAVPMWKISPTSFAGSLSSFQFPPVFVVKDDLMPEALVNVVEYFVPALKRYFMTGRKSEQATLDALPASFVRTGMSFAAKSSRYRDAIEQPVCRFYSPPVRGGSNTHFYGNGSDCAALNRSTMLQYEGFDFSVRQPRVDVNKEASCPDEAPFAVIRLYNNKAASNESNHRYVVSVESANRMSKIGWLNEGAVFCSTQVTGATVVE